MISLGFLILSRQRNAHKNINIFVKPGTRRVYLSPTNYKPPRGDCRRRWKNEQAPTPSLFFIPSPQKRPTLIPAHSFEGKKLPATCNISPPLKSKPAGRVPPDAILFCKRQKKVCKNGFFSCGGHLFRQSFTDQLTMVALTRAALLGTKSGARFLCGPQKR